MSALQAGDVVVHLRHHGITVHLAVTDAHHPGRIVVFLEQGLGQEALACEQLLQLAGVEKVESAVSTRAILYVTAGP